jgi:hypothetical protein
VSGDDERRSAHAEPDASGIDVESGVGSASGFGFVSLRWGAESGQLTTREARAHALSILEAADAAEHDAVVWRWLTGRMGMDPAAAGAVLVDLRRSRAELRDQGDR